MMRSPYTSSPMAAILGLAAWLTALAGCGAGPAGNDNSNGNGNVRTETRDFSSFIVFTYSAPLSCAEIGRVVDATIVDLREQGLGVRADLTVLEQGDPATDTCLDAPAERGCLVRAEPDSVTLDDARIDTVLQTFAGVEVVLDDEPDCTEDRCAEEFDWDAVHSFSSARCADAPRFGAAQAEAIRGLLESLRGQ